MTLAQADAHVDAGLLQVQRVGMALRPVADHGDLLPRMIEGSASSS